jgi:hypothetical protein
MKAITVRHPWAHAIIHLGKDVENRSWSTNYRGPLLIHVASTLTVGEYGRFAEFLFARFKDKAMPSPSELRSTLGGIIGIVDLDDVVQRSKSHWYDGRGYGFVLRHARPLPFRALSGRQMIFNVSESDAPSLRYRLTRGAP